MKQRAIILCALWLAGCASPPTTTPNTAPLEIGMNPEAASVALGAPLLPVLRGLPRNFAHDGVGPFLSWPALRRFGNALTHPVVCWLVMAVSLCAWHVPAAFELALRSPGRHS